MEASILVGHSKINGSLIRNSVSGSDKALLPLKVALICRYIALNPGLVDITTSVMGDADFQKQTPTTRIY